MDNIKLKKHLLEQEYPRLNQMQQKAVFQVNGPLLILAGAGSGKTTVLVSRIAHLLQFGNAYHNDMIGQDWTTEQVEFLSRFADGKESDRVRMQSLLHDYLPNPWNVLAITFTNKAANELKERLGARLGEQGQQVHSGTFHSICLRILRREIANLGYTSSFTIYDSDDSVRVLKDCLSDLNVSDKMFPPKAMLGEISRQKDRMQSPDQMLASCGDDFRLKTVANVYKLYQKRLKSANAVDFDDIILLTVLLLSNFPDVLAFYQNRYRYILVDEYQDTNQLQYRLVSLLSSAHQNLCVVGDDDQSIYKFRGATIENILSFEQQFSNATVIRLEQNYRSTQHILNGANQVIANNRGRKGKNLWTQNGDGEQITVFRGRDDFEETGYISDIIIDNISKGMRASDHAILYRMNAQSNSIERGLIKTGISYRIYGGTKFFDRKEIKDVLAYFHVMVNPTDSVRLKRIINEPKRGIGASTIQAVDSIASQTGLSMFDVMAQADTFEALSKKAKPLMAFTAMMKSLSDCMLQLPLAELLDEVMEQTGYRFALSTQGVEGRVRLENIEELKTNLTRFDEEHPDGSLDDFLAEIALFTDLDSLNASEDNVTLMTVHSAKGLEFPVVFLIGMEEGIFPGYSALHNPEEIEEERRLAYVGITRAKQKLHITGAAQRMIYGSISRNKPSRFVEELPEACVDLLDRTIHQTQMIPQPPASAGRVRQPEIASVGSTVTRQTATIDYAIGDQVSHKIFGKGTVLSLTPMGADTLVEVTFDRVGTKKIMANFAKLQKM